MKYCPECRVEYEDWPTECADCKVPLVSELPPEGNVTGDPINTAPKWTGGKVPVYESADMTDIHVVQEELMIAGIQSSVFEKKGFRGQVTHSRVVIVHKDQANEARRILDELIE